jgi:hypothetical protein
MADSIDSRPVPGSASSVSPSNCVWSRELRISTILDCPDAHVGIHGGDEFAAQLDPFAPDRGKSRQREGDGVRSGTQIDDAIQPLAVRHRRARARDERGAAGLDGHAGQHRPRGVPDDARDAALRPGGGRQQEHADDHESDNSLEAHLPFLSQ